MAKLFNVGEEACFYTKDDQGPQICVSNATVLGYTQDIEYFGSDIGFKKTITLDISCASTEISNSEGVSLAAKELLELLNSAQDYSEIEINKKEMGAGKVTGFSLPPDSDMVNVARCTISFLIHGEYDDIRDLGGYYEDYAEAAPKDFGQILDSFTDSISLSRGNNSTTYNRNISISANKSLNITELGDVIKSFVQDVLQFGTFCWPDFSEDEEDINKLPDPENEFKKFITETSDETSNTYTFRESLQATNIQNSYSSIITHSYTRTQNGIETVTENGAIIGLTDPRIDAAEDAYDIEFDKASDRMKGFYDKVGHHGDCPELNTLDGGGLLFLKHGKVTNTFEGTINYSLEANNDPTYKDGQGEKWEYTVTLDSDGVYQTATEQGSINGSGHIKYDPDEGDPRKGLEKYIKYQTAKTFLVDEVFKNDNKDLNDRITALIDTSEHDVSPEPTRRTESHAPRQGVITYTRSFSNNPIFQLNGDDDLIKKLETSATLQSTVPITHTFVSLRPDNEKMIIQEQSTESLSTVNSTINAVAYRIDAEDERNELNRIGELVKGRVDFVPDEMDGDTVYMNAATFSFLSLNDVSFTLNTSYNKGIGSC